jgi:hypothetical protein
MRRRISKDLLKAKRDELARSKEQRERYRTILEGKDSPFWKEVQRKIESKAKGVEERLDCWVDMPEKELMANLEQRKIYRFFTELVNESESVIEMISNRIVKIEEELKNMRDGAIV